KNCLVNVPLNEFLSWMGKNPSNKYLLLLWITLFRYCAITVRRPRPSYAIDTKFVVPLLTVLICVQRSAASHVRFWIVRLEVVLPSTIFVTLPLASYCRLRCAPRPTLIAYWLVVVLLFPE